MSRQFSRRDLVLRFGPAAALLWPLLRSSRATAQTVFPKRFITVFSSSGVEQSSFWPTGTPGLASSGSYSVDGTGLEPLKPLLGDVIISRNIRINRGPGDAHDSGSVSILTGDYLKATDVNTRPFAFGQSMDQFLAPRLSAGRPEPYLLQGVRLQINRISKYVSFDAQGRPLEFLQDPYAVYERILKTAVTACTGNTGDSTLAQTRFKRRSVLDAIRPQVASMRQATGLGAAEEHKLERVEESIRSVERRLDALTIPPSTVNPRCVSTKQKMESATRVANSDANYPALLTLHLDLLALAMELDITRVATLSMTLGGSGGATMSWLRWNDNGTMRPIDGSHHTVTHGARAGILNSGAKLRVIDRWNFSQFAYLLSALKNINEGGRTALDNSIVWYGTDCAEGSGHSVNNVPFVVAGKAGGSLQTGRYIQFPSEVSHQRLLLTFLHKLGYNEPSWGRAGASAGSDIF